jgi:hypothetical protein
MPPLLTKEIQMKSKAVFLYSVFRLLIEQTEVRRLSVC